LAGGGKEPIQAKSKRKSPTGDCDFVRTGYSTPQCIDSNLHVKVQNTVYVSIAMLSKTAEYALRAVACLASSPDQSFSADVLAERTHVPRRYLTRVLQDLCAAGLIHSRSGPGGGYELCESPAKITILDIVNHVDPIARIRSCPLGLKTHTKLCPLHAELDKAYAATEKAFAKVTLKALLESTSPIIPLCES